MTTAWSHLPNAKHIDWVLASLKSHPEKWSAARVWHQYVARDAALDAALGVAYNAAWDAARYAAWDAALDAALGVARYAALDAARDAATDAILALIAYNDCAYMIESEVDELRIIAAFGVPAAVLLLPACKVFNETKEHYPVMPVMC